MKIKKPKFWDSPNILIPVILFPITILVMLLSFVFRKLSSTKRFSIKVICIGNIYIGGTGKTPLSIKIADLLENKDFKVAIIKKNYQNQNDEKKLIESAEKKVFFENKRSNSLKIAISQKYEVAILDDGMQDYSIYKDLNIVCFTSNQPIGNGFTIPSGPLRENLKAINKCDIAMINGKPNLAFEKKLLNINDNIKIYYSRYNLVNKEFLKEYNYLAFAGIGNPENFFNLLEKEGINVKKRISFPDHYSFSNNDIMNLFEMAKKENLNLITTEKDSYRLSDDQLKNISIAKINLKIDNLENLQEEILNKIQ